ncbi:hypothetical protein PT974_09235 [Cladobotryum mycophilum]|uniref:CFEM domain-containing protein n=1 Tax=Cladobotryum mycophilum TaxID=491253 RepID=A0ABR0SGR1_9HYPO
MRRFILCVLGALSVIDIHGVLAQDAPACVPACLNQLRGEFAKFACTSADDAACLCANSDFFFGVRDCAPSCATDVQVHDFLAGSFCQGKSLPFTPTETLPAATQTTLAATTEPPITTSSPPTSAPIESSTSLPTTTEASSEPGLSTTAPPTTSETASPTTSASSSTTLDSTVSTTPPSTASVTPATATSGSETSETSAVSPSPANSGLSQAAVIGIGVGIGAAVIAIAFVAIFLVLRNRKRAPRQSIDISKSFPGSGRTHPNPDQGPFEKYASDIEMVSNRYEDMVPRAQPRTLV